MKLRVYLDTSVFSAYWDDREHTRQTATQEFWGRLNEFEVTTSELAAKELNATADPLSRQRYQELLSEVAIHALTDEMRDLAGHYIAAGVFTSVMFNDALHVAAAVLTRQDVLLSWNFKHLVNRRRRAQVNQINVTLGLPTIDIVAPPEI